MPELPSPTVPEPPVSDPTASQPTPSPPTVPSGDEGPVDRPLVSVVIPNYNHASFVVDAVRSALDQTYPHLEIHVVDDASADRSVARLQHCFGDRISVTAKTTNEGQIRAVECGVAATTGEVVCLLDADDRWQPTKVERVVDVLTRDPTVAQVSHGLHTISADGSPLTGRRGGRSRYRVERRMPLSEGEVRSLLFRWNRYGYGLTSGLAYPRWALERMLPVPDEFAGRRHFFDAWSTVAAAFLGPVAAIDENLMDYRIHDGNAVAASTDFERLAEHRRTTGRMVDHWARRVGDGRRSDVDARDANLILFRHLAGEDVPVSERLRVLARTPLELRQIRSQPLDGAIQAAERVVMAVSRRQGTRVKELGLNRWLRQRLP